MSGHQALPTTVDEKTSAELETPDRLVEAILAIARAREAGGDIDEILANYADLEAELRAHLDREFSLGIHRSCSDPLRTVVEKSLAGKYELLGEIGAGAFGRVFKARDLTLGRFVAVKVFKRSLAKKNGPTRFRDETQVASQLDHTGIATIFERAELSDGKPYFVMKLVEGVTLAALLKDGPFPDVRPWFLEILKRICQTVGVAHKKGVLHRDLKPANVMVGDGVSGEVFVMDWGLSKVMLAIEDEATDDKAAQCGARSELVTQAGTRIGTIAYMAPEQARGEEATPQSDVFSLGAILCEILTGHPPYWDSGPENLLYLHGDSTVSEGAVARAVAEMLERVEKGEVDTALASIKASDADASIKSLACECLAPKAKDRPHDAGEVAERILDYQNGLQAKIRQQELDAAARESRQDAETGALRARLSATRWRGAAAVVLILAIAGGTLAHVWYTLDSEARLSAQTAREAVRNDDANQMLDQLVAALKGNQLETAKRLLGTVEGRVAEGAPAALKTRIKSAERDLAFIDERERIRAKRAYVVNGGEFDDASVAHDYAEAFRQYGINLSDREGAAQGIQASAIRDQLIAALDHWALVETVPGSRRRLLLLARALSTTEWGKRFRDPDIRRDPRALLKLAEETKPGQNNSVEIESLAWAMMRNGSNAEPLLRRGLTLYHNDLWLNLLMALSIEGKARKTNNAELRRRSYEEAVGFARVACAMSSKSALAHELLGRLLMESDRYDEAINELKLAIQNQPDMMTFRYSLARAYLLHGDLEAAENACGEALRVAPESQPLAGLMKEIKGARKK